VLSALGPPGPAQSTTILRDSARSLVSAMQIAAARRLLVVSAAVLFEDAGIFVSLMRRTLLRNVAEDNAAMERLIMASDLAWTIARPPRLTNGQTTGRYRVAEGHLPGAASCLAAAMLPTFCSTNSRAARIRAALSAWPARRSHAVAMYSRSAFVSPSISSTRCFTTSPIEITPTSRP
jgi:NAD(P)H-binding